ncbi:MAG: tetratricopeptide repeat protein [Candidatus Xenobia bacterium]
MLFCRGCRDTLRASQIDPASLTTRIRRGVRLAGSGRLLQSVEEFQKALETDGENRGAFESLMVLYGSLNQLEDAADLVQRFHFEVDAAGNPLFAVARFYHQRRFDVLAEHAIRRAMEDGESAEGHILLGRIYREQENWQKAVQAFRRALKLSPGNASVHCDLGTALLKQGEPDKARTQLARAVQIEPDNATYHFYMATVHEARGDLQRASKEMRVAASLNREFLIPSIDLVFQIVVNRIREGDAHAAAQEWERCAGDNPEVFDAAFLQECQQFLSRVIAVQHVHNLFTQYPTLRCLEQRTFQRLQASFHEAPRVAFYLGLAHHWFAADKQVDTGYRAFPTVPLDFVFEEWMNLHSALSHSQLTERPLAPLEIYELLIGATGHTLGKVREVLADVLSQMVEEETEDEDEDVEMPLERALGTTLWAVTLESYLLAEAIRRCRDYSDAFYSHFHAARAHRENRQYPRAIVELERAVALHPQSAALRNMLWNLYIRQDRYTDAIKHCQETLEFSPHRLYRAAACNDMAYCFVEMGGSLSEAMELTQQARELAPTVFDHHIDETRAWAYYREGRYTEALLLMEKVLEALKDEPPSSVHLYHYGKILQAVGRRELARKVFERALEVEVSAESDWGISRKVRSELSRWGDD